MPIPLGELPKKLREYIQDCDARNLHADVEERKYHQDIKDRIAKAKLDGVKSIAVEPLMPQLRLLQLVGPLQNAILIQNEAIAETLPSLDQAMRKRYGSEFAGFVDDLGDAINALVWDDPDTSERSKQSRIVIQRAVTRIEIMNTAKPAATSQVKGFMSASELAIHTGKSLDTVNGRLKQLSDGQRDAMRTPIENPAKGEPRYLWRVTDVMPLLSDDD